MLAARAERRKAQRKLVQNKGKGKARAEEEEDDD